MRRWLLNALMLGLPGAAGAVPPQLPYALEAIDGVPPAQPAATQIAIDVGKGQLVDLHQPLASIIAVDPKVVRVQPVSHTAFYVMALEQGATTLVAVNTSGGVIGSYAVVVRASALRNALYDPVQVEAAIHGAIRTAGAVRVAATPNGVLLSGPIPNADEAAQAVAIARGMVGDKVTIVNRMDLLSSIQVNVRVRFVEVSREVSRSLGINWQTIFNAGSKFAVGFATGDPLFAADGTVIGRQADLTSITGATPSRLGGTVDTKNFDLNAAIDALSEKRLISVLAEPNLTALSGETASFLAGGEFPIPVQASTTGQISVEFKPFGISLSFVPTVLSPDRLNLRVRPEVSELTDAGSISVPLSGGVVKIPALSVRRAETSVELGSGQSFAIAGLLQSNSTRTTTGVPGLSRMPVLGALFRSKDFRNDRSELVIIVTPYLVRPVSSQDQLSEPYITPDFKIGARPSGSNEPMASDYFGQKGKKKK